MSDPCEEKCQGRAYGVFNEDGFPDKLPFAIFADRADALEWAEWQAEKWERGEGRYNADHCPIMRTDIYASYWNGDPEEDPKAGGFEDFMAGLFRAGAQAMREMLARFVEQGGGTGGGVEASVIAQSMRLNWHPGWGADPGRPEKVVGDCWEA